MSLARYKAFVAVAQQGSLSAAARTLGVSQPTVSAQINTLERQSRVELFHRRGYRMQLSWAGEHLLILARQLLALEAETDFFLRDTGMLHQGELKLGAVGPFHVIEMVAAYRKNHPAMNVSIRVGNSKQVLADLEQYTIDIGVLAGLHESEQFETLPYARHPIILFAPTRHPLAQHRCVPIHALQGMELLRREKGSTTQAALDDALQKAGVTTRTTLEIGSRKAMREAVARGLGVGMVSEAEFIPDPRFSPVRIEGDPAFTSTYLYFARERRDSLLLQSFIRALPLPQQHFGNLINTQIPS